MLLDVFHDNVTCRTVLAMTKLELWQKTQLINRLRDYRLLDETLHAAVHVVNKSDGSMDNGSLGGTWSARGMADPSIEDPTCGGPSWAANVTSLDQFPFKVKRRALNTQHAPNAWHVLAAPNTPIGLPKLPNTLAHAPQCPSMLPNPPDAPQ
jgi:hypothetical protein